MTVLSTPELIQLRTYIQNNQDARDTINEIAAGLHNQIRYFGIEQNDQCKSMVQNALMLGLEDYKTQFVYAEIDEDEKASLTRELNKAALTYPPRDATTAGIENMTYFQEFAVRHAAADILDVAAKAAREAMRDPHCGIVQQLKTDALMVKWGVKDSVDPVELSNERLASITEAMQAYTIIEIGAQLQRLFKNHIARTPSVETASAPAPRA